MSEPLNAVIDISHHDGNVNLAKAKEVCVRRSDYGEPRSVAPRSRTRSRVDRSSHAMVTVMVALSISQWCAANATNRAVSGGRPAGRPAAQLADASGGS